MRFYLYCQGQLLPGAREEKSVRKIRKIIHRTEEEIRGKILTGEPRKLTSSSDESLINRLHCSLRKAGLDVEIKCVEEPVRSSDVTIRRVDMEESSTEPDIFSIQSIDHSQKRKVVIVVALLLVIFAGFAWYWL